MAQMGPCIPSQRSLDPSMACGKLAMLGLGAGEGVADVTGGGVDGDRDRVSNDAAASEFYSESTVSSLTNDDEDEVMSSAAAPGRGDHRPASYSSWSSSSSDTVQMDGNGAGGPLYELAPLLDHLPVRTGLSKYYQGKSQSFTSLSDAKCPEDLAKKTTPYNTRMKLQRGPGLRANLSSSSRHFPGPCSKTIAKKTPRWSPDQLLSRARSTSLLHSSSKPPAYQS